MITRIICTISIFVSCLATSYGQAPQVQLGPEIEIREQDEYQGVIQADDTGYIINIYERSGRGLLGEPGRKLILERYSTNFEQIFSYEYGEKETSTVELVSTGSSIIWVVLEKINSYKYSYSMVPIGLDGREGKKQKLFTIEVAKASDIPRTRLFLSPDSTKVAFTATFDTDSKKEETEIYTAVASDHGDVLWDEWTKLRGNQKQYDIQDQKLTKGGELLLLTKYFKNEDGKKTVKIKNDKEVAGYSMEMLRIHPDLPKTIKYPLEVDKHFVHNAAIVIDPLTDEILGSGLTSSKEGGNINGVFFERFDSEYNLLVNNHHKISTKELISFDKLNADVNLKRGKAGLDQEFVMRDIIPMPDGRTIITVEEIYTRRINNNINPTGIGFTRNNFNNSESVTLYTNDIVVIEVNKDGTINNMDLIPKKQSVSQFSSQGLSFSRSVDLKARELFLSYTYMRYGNKLLFFYNDRNDNFDRDMDNRRGIERSNRMQTAYVELTDKDIFDIRPLIPQFNSDYVVSTTRSKQISENKYFLSLLNPSNRNVRSVRLGILSF